MKIAGTYTFEATREEVWAALNSPEVLARTIPGCQRLDQISDYEYESTLKVGLQAVRGVYGGRVRIDNLLPPESYELHVDGKGSNGFLKGAGTIRLRTDGAHTILDYGGEAQVGGTIANVGQRLIEGAARTLINQSLKALAQQIAERRFAHAAVHTAEVQAAVAAELSHPPSVPPTAGVAADVPPVSIANPALAAPVASASSASPVAPLDPASNGVIPPAAPPIRRSISVPAGQGLSEATLVRGTLEDFFKQNPWLPWLIVAFLLGYLFGNRRPAHP